jgi:uncharacterized membrane protein YqjE
MQTDARGWIGIGVYLLTVAVLVIFAFVPDLRQDDFFQTIATLIVGAYIKDVVGWAYSATKSGSELAQTNSRIIEKNMADAGQIKTSEIKGELT